MKQNSLTMFLLFHLLFLRKISKRLQFKAKKNENSFKKTGK